jgi:hypothetical protein
VIAGSRQATSFEYTNTETNTRGVQNLLENMLSAENNLAKPARFGYSAEHNDACRP